MLHETKYYNWDHLHINLSLVTNFDKWILLMNSWGRRTRKRVSRCETHYKNVINSLPWCMSQVFGDAAYWCSLLFAQLKSNEAWQSFILRPKSDWLSHTRQCFNPHKKYSHVMLNERIGNGCCQYYSIQCIKK